jgi:hypothetical protein
VGQVTDSVNGLLEGERRRYPLTEKRTSLKYWRIRGIWCKMKRYDEAFKKDNMPMKVVQCTLKT